jgi:hypothetical protein
MTTNLALGLQTLDGYKAQVEGALALALKQATATLNEPTRVTPDARKVIAGMIELICGFALGTIASEVFAGVQQWFGHEVSAELQRRFKPAITAVPRLDVRYLADAEDRPLVNALGSRLHVRFCYLSRDVAGLLANLGALVGELPRQSDVMRVMLCLMSGEDDIQTRVAAEIIFAWSMFVSSMTGKPAPTLEGRSARSQGMWQAWQGRATPTARPPRDDVQRDGYILLVA